MNSEKCSLALPLPLGCSSVSSGDKPKNTAPSPPQSHQNAHRIKNKSMTSAAPPLEEEEEEEAAFYHAGAHDIPFWHRKVLSFKFESAHSAARPHLTPPEDASSVGAVGGDFQIEVAECPLIWFPPDSTFPHRGVRASTRRVSRLGDAIFISLFVCFQHMAFGRRFQRGRQKKKQR